MSYLYIWIINPLLDISFVNIFSHSAQPLWKAVRRFLKKLKKERQATLCPLKEKQVNKTWYVHTMEYCSALQRKEMPTRATTWMNLEGIMLSAINQSQKDEHYVILPI